MLAWFEKHKSMQSWLYAYFINELGPQLQEKSGRNVAKPLEYEMNTFWVKQPDPIFSLCSGIHQISLKNLFMPQIFLWLPHFLVENIACSNCNNNKLEKKWTCCPLQNCRHWLLLLDDHMALPMQKMCQALSGVVLRAAGHSTIPCSASIPCSAHIL